MIDENSCSSAIWELGKAQKAFNELQDKYKKLLEFVKELPFVDSSDDEIIRELNDPCQNDTDFIYFSQAKEIRKFLKEIGEL